MEGSNVVVVRVWEATAGPKGIGRLERRIVDIGTNK